MQPYTVVPTTGRVAVRVLEAKDRTDSGIYIVSNVPEPATHGEVVALWEPYEEEGVTYFSALSLGDWVLFGRYTGTKITVDRDTVIILHEKDILCTLVQKPNKISTLVGEHVAVSDRAD